MPERRLLLFALCLLAGCSPGPEALWSDYLSRLERLTGSEAAVKRPTPPRYPRRRTLRQPLPDLRTGLMRYLELKQCGLREMVSRRNSSLGKLQAPSLRLAYELEFIHRARQCLASPALADDEEMRDWLSRVVAIKEQALAPLMWNLSLAGREMAGFFSYSGGAPATGAPEDSAVTRRALETLGRLAGQVNSSPPPDSTGDLENALASLDHSDTGGRLIMGMALATAELERAATLMGQLAPAELCPGGRTSRRAERLHNVFTAIYTGRVQPWLSALWRAARPLGDRLAQLREQQPVVSPPLDQWRIAVFSEQGLSGRLERASRDHAEAWHRILEPCGLAPRRPGG